MSWFKYSLVGIVLVGCGAAVDGDSPISTTTTSIAQTTTTSEVTTTVPLPDGLPEALVDVIIADASDRTGVEHAEIEVLSIESTTFSDTSLGCPEPGKMYAQVMTPGIVVLLDADGEQLDYRVAESGGSFSLCR